MQTKRSLLPYVLTLSLAFLVIAGAWTVYFVLKPASWQASVAMVEHMRLLSRCLREVESTIQNVEEISRIDETTSLARLEAIRHRGERQSSKCDAMISEARTVASTSLPLPASREALERAKRLLDEAMKAAPTVPVTSSAASLAPALSSDPNDTGIPPETARMLLENGQVLQAQCIVIADKAAQTMGGDNIITDTLLGLPAQLWLAILATVGGLLAGVLVATAMLRGRETPLIALEREIDRAARRDPRGGRDTCYKSIDHLLDVADQIARRTAG